MDSDAAYYRIQAQHQVQRRISERKGVQNNLVETPEGYWKIIVTQGNSLLCRGAGHVSQVLH